MNGLACALGGGRPAAHNPGDDGDDGNVRVSNLDGVLDSDAVPEARNVSRKLRDAG